MVCFWHNLSHVNSVRALRRELGLTFTSARHPPSTPRSTVPSTAHGHRRRDWALPHSSRKQRTHFTQTCITKDSKEGRDPPACIRRSIIHAASEHLLFDGGPAPLPSNYSSNFAPTFLSNSSISTLLFGFVKWSATFSVPLTVFSFNRSSFTTS